MKYLLFILFTVPSEALAEVSDKIPSILNIWIFGVVGTVVLFVLAYFSRWLFFLGLGFVGIMTYGSISMITEPHLGEAIIREQGLKYPVSLFATDLLMLCGAVGGYLMLCRKNKNAT